MQRPIHEQSVDALNACPVASSGRWGLLELGYVRQFAPIPDSKYEAITLTDL